MNTRFLQCLAVAALLGHGAIASAQRYPSRPIQLMVPFDAGSSTDVVARAMQPTLAAKLGVSVLVVNKPGASGTIGAADLARQQPDGHAIGILGMGGIAMLPHVRKLSFDLESFDFVCQIYSAPVIVMVAPNAPHRDIRALIDYGKTNPEKLFYGSPGIGTPDHINMANFLRQNGVVGTHVPFQGSGAVSQAILSNQITAVSNTTVLLRAYNLRPLAVLTPQRLPSLPDVPSAGEFGPPVDASIWAVLAAPRGLPATVLAALEQACRATLEDPAYLTIAERAGFPPLFRDGAAFRTFVGGEFTRYGSMMKAEGLDLK